MNKLFKQIGGFLCKTWVWTLLLALLAALGIWFIGPLLAVDDYRFWASPIARLLSISALVLAWGLTMVFVNWRAGVSKKAGQDKRDAEQQDRETRIGEEQHELKTRFKEALKTLKSSSLYQGRSERWRNDLPWYLLIGAPGSGKTSLLDFSGLDFPINRIERKLTRDTQGTQHCEWYFAEHAVLIDTPGRYLTHPDARVDGRAWQALLTLLRGHRRQRPLNGILVTLDVYSLLNGSEEDLDQLARNLRERLGQVRQALHVEVPVYLVLSKADSLLGFNDFFDALSREESDQVFGSSFRQAQGGADALLLRGEFEKLLERLNSQVIMRMHQERGTDRRGRILDFPHQLALIGERLSLFVDMAFTGNRYQHACRLRGFYLTSSPHLTGKLDKSTAGIGARLGVDSGMLPTLRDGRSRFIHDLLSRVIFPEADLAGLDQQERRRIDWGQRAVYLGALGVLALLGVLWAGGFSANHARLEELRNLAHNWARQHAQQGPRDEALHVLGSLDTRYAATLVFPDRDETGYHERAGLYQGEAVNPVVSAAYERELQEQLLPQVASLLQAQVRGSLQDRERLLDSLRAYLMLNMKERRDAPWLMEWVAAEWSRRHPGNSTVQSGLNSHFARLMQQPFVVALDERLVAQARQVLRSEAPATVLYRMLREQARNLPDYRLSQHLGPQGTWLAGTDYLIPGFYTQKGYQQYFTVQGAALATHIQADNWVLGAAPELSLMDQRRLMVELEQLYFHDYANHWGEAVSRVGLLATDSYKEGAEQLAGLTSSHSPLLQLLAQVRENTRFPGFAEALDSSAEAAAQLAGQGGKLGELASAAAGKAADALGKATPDNARKALQARFEPLHRLLDGNEGPTAELGALLVALNDLQIQLASLARASSAEQAAFEMAKARLGGQRDALSNLRAASGRLPRPMNAWFNGLGEDTWRLMLGDAYQYVNQRYQSELYGFYAKAISQRYPFSARSASDVAISDFREFFKAQGIAERFFDNYMRPFVNGSPGHYRLRTLDGHGLPVSRTYLDQMATVQLIRQGFFAENPAEPLVQFKLEPYTLDPAVSRAEFRLGDKVMEYRHGPILPMSFKWPVEAQDGRTSLVLDRMAGRPLGIERSTGPWSLFRLLDLMQTEYLRGRDVLVLKADVGGLRAHYLLTSQRTPNPFDMSVLRGFHMPVQL